MLIIWVLILIVAALIYGLWLMILPPLQRLSLLALGIAIRLGWIE